MSPYDDKAMMSPYVDVWYTVGMLLLCNPDEPGWINAPNSVKKMGDCGHPVMVSPGGVGSLLTTPGLKAICIRCVPPGTESIGMLPMVEAELTELLGPEATERLKRDLGG